MTLEPNISPQYSPNADAVVVTNSPSEWQSAAIATPTLPAAPGPLVQSILRNGNQPLFDGNTTQAQQLAAESAPETNRNGLTSTSPVRTHALLGKRRSSRDGGPNHAVVFARPRKRARLAAPGGLDLRSVSAAPKPVLPPGDGLTSPLFFSSSARHMSGRPLDLSSSEAAASIMRRLREGHGEPAVTTVKLARGNVSSAGTPRSSGTPSGRSALDTTPPTAGSEWRPLPEILQVLQGVGVIELLEQDERPTFIIDLKNSINFGPGQLQIVFMNASLRASQGVKELLASDSSDPTTGADFSRFKAWVVSFVKNNESLDVCLPSLSYAGMSWTCSTLRRRFRFVSGNMSAISTTPTSPNPITYASSVLDQRARGPTPTRDTSTPIDRPLSDVDYFGEVDRDTKASRRRAHSEPREKGDVGLEAAVQHNDDLALNTRDLEAARLSFDWTRIPLSTPNISPHVQFARSVNWAATPLGPIEEWPAELRSMSNMIMGSPYPAALYWGPEYVAIYNEAFITMAGKKHPRLMGTRYRDGYAEIWDKLEPVFSSAWNSGQATMKHDDRMFMIRQGFLEETFFNWSIVPLVGGDGSVVALYNPAFENTRRKVVERTMLTLREVGEKTSHARDVKGFWPLVVKGLEYNEYDVPFALVYSVSDETESEVSSMHSGTVANPPQIALEGSLGAPTNHHAAVPYLDLRVSEEGFASYMRASMSQQGTPVVLKTEDDTLPARLIEGLEWRGFGDPCRTIVIFPVHPTTAGDSVVGFIVMGVNPRRPFDDDYQLFIQLLSRQLATSLASVVLFEDEISRGQRAARLAAMDRQELSTQLRLRTEEAVESDYKFTKMAEFAPVGMFIADDQGVIKYCNDTWWQISGHPKFGSTLDNWMQSVRDEDRHGVSTVWDKLVREKVAVTHEFRFKRPRQVAGQIHDTWALMSAYPERNEWGNLKSIFGCITDISEQKWAEDFQKQRREEAVELKRQQDNFIDITSHEMRNPLSAVLQCADEISDSITRYRADGPASYEPGKLNVLLDSCLEAANTVSLCASHQKRIVDDILTLSKLDSQLLLVTPSDVQPIVLVQKVLKIFEPELNSNDVQADFRVEKSYRDLGIDWVKLDPSRLRQILINLMTNAITFTQSQEKRSVVIRLGATRQPSEVASGNPSGAWKSSTTSAEWASSDASGVDIAGVSYFDPRRADREGLTNDPEWGDGEKINLHLAVTDTGPGLTADEKKVLFQKFSQGSPRTHVQYGGSGLGLFICRILTELQGGQIGFVSQAGTGSTFTFYIQSRKSTNPGQSPAFIAPAPMSSTESTTDQHSARSNPPEMPSHHTPRTFPSSSQAAILAGRPNTPFPFDILIVEDNIVNQKVLQKQLRIWGHNTLVANHGGEALEALRRSRYWSDASALGNRNEDHGSENINISIILLDLEMPVMDGMTCARKIRQLERDGTLLQHIPIIAVTAYARREQIASAMAAGIDGVITKPFRIPELLPKIEELVAKYNTLLSAVAR